MGPDQAHIINVRTSTNGIDGGSTDPIIRVTNDYREEWPDVRALLCQKLRKTCTRQLIFDRLPVIGWARGYRWSYVYHDFVAGLTVGLTAIPQGIAYAVVAGLDPQYGLYAELLGSFIYCVLGSCRNVTIGPTAIMALMVQNYALQSPDFALLSAFLCGIIILAMGMLNLGFLVHFISLPVTVGFTTAAAFSIGSLQVKSVLGLPGRSTDFLDAWIHVFENIGHTRLWDTVLGLSSIAFLFALKKIGDIKQSKYSSAFKYISLARNALVVLFGSVLAYILTKDGQVSPFALTGKIQSGFPPVQLPPFSTIVGNQTLDFSDMVSTLGTSLASIPFIAILEIVAVAKAFSKGKSIDATQEMIALGCCNIFGSFVGSMPVTGSFTRTAVNEASEVRTPFGGLVTGTIVLLAVGFLTSTFRYIPKASLAAVIITAMIYMVEVDFIKSVWRARRKRNGPRVKYFQFLTNYTFTGADILPFFATFIGSLVVSLDAGIVIGIAVNLMFVLYATARPKTDIIHTKVNNRNVLLIVPDQSLIFSAAENLKYRVLKHAKAIITSTGHADDEPTRNDGDIISVVVINGEFVQTIDVTVAKYLQSIATDLRALDKVTLFWNWKRQPTGVAWRLSRELGEQFHHANTVEQLLVAANVSAIQR